MIIENINEIHEVDEDMKDARHHAVYVQGPSVLLPDASYYKEAMAAQKEMILGIWTNIAKMILSKSNLSVIIWQTRAAFTLPTPLRTNKNSFLFIVPV